MWRLRRPNRGSWLIPVAAEVLEVRSLLSAGVHAAVAHAQHEVQAATKPVAPTIHFPANYFAFVSLSGLINGNPVSINNIQFERPFQNPSGTVAVGKSVKFTTSATIGQTVAGVLVNSINGTIGGKVKGISAGGGGGTNLDMIPSGHFTISVTVAGKTINLKAAPSPGHALTFFLDPSNNFGSVQGQYQITKPKGTALAVNFDFADGI